MLDLVVARPKTEVNIHNKLINKKSTIDVRGALYGRAGHVIAFVQEGLDQSRTDAPDAPVTIAMLLSAIHVSSFKRLDLMQVSNIPPIRIKSARKFRERFSPLDARE